MQKDVFTLFSYQLLELNSQKKKDVKIRKDFLFYIY